MIAKLILLLVLMNVNCFKLAKRVCNRQNEHYECGSVCQKTCAALDIVCPIPNVNCHDGCYCDLGFARNSRGRCIPILMCPVNKKLRNPRPRLVCDRENEHYECGSACQTTCATLGTVCPIVNIRCNDACYCDEGFARDDNGVCIPEGECPRRSRERRAHKKPASICPGKFEVYTDCYKDCPPNTCLSLVAKFKCDGSEPCKKGCVCQSGYLRQKADTPCIPIRECMEMKNAPQ